jgi:sugar-specific transcriptional regulator TrmB
MPSPGRPGHFAAAPPGLALGAALTQRRHELNQAELAIAQLAEEYRLGSADVSLHELVEPVAGAEPIRRRFEQLQLGAEREVLALVTASPAVVSGMENDAEPLAVSRGVSFRVVAERSVLDGPFGLTELSAALDREEQVRVVDRVPSRLLVADRQTALIPLHDWSGKAAQAEPAALVVYADGLVEALVALFELVWAAALPVRVGEAGAESPEGDRPDETDLRILSLLLLGLTDASVAKQLDLGLRTVQRRVKNLMDLAGVTTRMQLGWHAYERGWVSRGPRR